MSYNHIDLRSARHIVSLAEHLSFTRAASALCITQSALSRSIQQVEQELGLKLFDRDRSRVHLTAVGEIVVEGAATLLRHSLAFDDVLDRLSGGEQSFVKFGMARTAAAALLPRVLENELINGRAHRNLVAVRSFDALVDLLVGGDIEFFISAEQVSPRAGILESIRIARFPMTQLVRPDHPLLSQASREDYDAFPWMISSMFAASTNADELGYPHLRPIPQIVVEDLGCAASLAQRTDMIWITSSFSATQELHDGRLVQLPFPTKVVKALRAPYKLMVYLLPNRTLSPAARHLVDRFKTLASGIENAVALKT